MDEVVKDKQCYNCGNIASTREHIIQKFILSPNEEGLTIPCCDTCRIALKWLDDYGADYIRYHRSQEDIDEWEKWFKHRIVQNGSPMSLRDFGEDTVINEDLLMRFVHKICVGVAYRLFGRLDDSYRINIFTNFSKLGGHCQYNDPNEKSLTQEQTIKAEKARDMIYSENKKTVDIYSVLAYRIKNAKIFYTAKHIVNGAMWFHVSLYGKFNILCAIVDGVSPEFAQARNMMIASLPVRIDLSDLERLRDKIRQTGSGDRLAYILAGSPISPESQALRRSSLEAVGVSNDEIEAFESSLIDLMNNKGGRERLAERFRESLKHNRKRH